MLFSLIRLLQFVEFSDAFTLLVGSVLCVVFVVFVLSDCLCVCVSVLLRGWLIGCLVIWLLFGCLVG